MTAFPVWIPIGPWRVHPHLVFESLAYAVGFSLYLTRRRRLGDPLSDQVRWSLVTAAAIGAVIGSRVLFWLEEASATFDAFAPLKLALGGKTVVGALLGGWIAVELEKLRLHVTQPTGDLFALPLTVGMAIGRIGCFLSGLPDGTYGAPTSLPWGVDLGDGVLRHPTALYESFFMAALAIVLLRARRFTRQGDLFKLFLSSYLAFRLAVDTIKPGAPIALHLTAIQWACVAGLAFQVRSSVRARLAPTS